VLEGLTGLALLAGAAGVVGTGKWGGVSNEEEEKGYERKAGCSPATGNLGALVVAEGAVGLAHVELCGWRESPSAGTLVWGTNQDTLTRSSRPEAVAKVVAPPELKHLLLDLTVHLPIPPCPDSVSCPLACRNPSTSMRAHPLKLCRMVHLLAVGELVAHHVKNKHVRRAAIPNRGRDGGSAGRGGVRQRNGCYNGGVQRVIRPAQDELDNLARVPVTPGELLVVLVLG